jgi:hypothetical protein
MRTRLLCLTVVGFATLLPAAAAGADGLPLAGIDGGAGVASAQTHSRYVTFATGRNTVLAHLTLPGGQVSASRTIPGTWSVPAVGFDGSGGGLSGDGRSLVLVRPRTSYPVKQTDLLFLDTARLRTVKHITLKGDFGFDAISPNASTLYLTNYLSANDPTKYSVRAYDVGTGRLAADPVIDPNEKGPMTGLPLTRTMSPGGRWAYTLYDGLGKHPFIHALDTVGRKAKCIDLQGISADVNDLGALRLRVGSDGRQLSVVSGTRPLTLVDTASFAITYPPPPAAAAPRASSRGSDGGNGQSFPWLLVSVLGLGAAVAAAATAAVRRSAGGAGAR